MKRLLAWRPKASRGLVQQRPEHVETHSFILSLPFEILEFIVSLLEYDFGLAFSLTCKQTYNMFFHSIKQTSPYHQKLLLLRLIDRDMKDQLLCEYHCKFYVWRKEKANGYRCPGCLDPPHKSSSIAFCGPACKTPEFRHVNNSIRRLMLRCASQGPESGISLNRYSHSCPVIGKGSNRVQLKIVGPRFMVRRTLRVQAIVDDTANLVRDTSFLSLCLHGSSGYHGLLLAAVRHISTHRENFSQSARWSCPLLFKCRQCATDVKLSIEQETAKTAMIEFDAYHDLGCHNDPSFSQRRLFCSFSQIAWESVDIRDAIEVQRLKVDLSSEFHSLQNQNFTIKNTSERTFLDMWEPSIKNEMRSFTFIHSAKQRPVPVYCSEISFNLLKD